MAQQSPALRPYADAARLLPVDPARLSVRSLTCRPRAQGCLDGVSFDVERGELFCVVGPAGSGKSLLLRAIAGLEQPDAGYVYVDGQDVGRLPPGRRSLGMVFPGGALPPHRSLRGLLDPSSGPLPWRRGSDEALLRSRLELIAPGLAAYLGARCGRLPPVVHAQASIAWALLRRPRLLLLDDPLVRVDQPIRERIARHLKLLVETLGLTTVYATLDQAEGLAIGHRVAVLRAGVLEQVGTPHGLQTLPRNLFVATWVHYAGLNLLRLRPDLGGYQGPRLLGPGFVVPLEPPWAERARGRSEVVVAIRPERLRLVEPGSEALYRATVQAVEPLPWERRKRVHLAGPAGEQVAVVPFDREAAPGQTVGVALDLAEALLFDGLTGEAA